MEQKRLGIPRNVPVAVQQWEGLIAVNYAARAAGITRHMRVNEAKQKCPELICCHVQTLGGPAAVLTVLSGLLLLLAQELLPAEGLCAACPYQQSAFTLPDRKPLSSRMLHAAGCMSPAHHHSTSCPVCMSLKSISVGPAEADSANFANPAQFPPASLVPAASQQMQLSLVLAADMGNMPVPDGAAGVSAEDGGTQGPPPMQDRSMQKACLERYRQASMEIMLLLRSQAPKVGFTATAIFHLGCDS